MLGKKKKAALEYYQKNAAGEYVYTGALLHYVTEGKSRKKALAELWCLTLVVAGCNIGVGLFPAPGTVNTFYVLIPMLIAIILSCLCLWTVGEITAGGDPLKEYVYEGNVKSLPGRLTAVTVCSLLTVICELLYLILNGGWCGAVIGVLALEAGAAALAQVTKRMVLALQWQKNG